jgi:hypothetical protein
MSGGAVSGNTSSSYGGGVYVASSGAFSMSGGAVSGNTSTYEGGGVDVYDGTFSMSGGAVSGNTSSSSSGGGVEVSGSGATFSMSGGAVSGNTSSSYGGGVYVSSGTFSMSGGAVRDNTLSNTNGYGRELLVYGGTFKMSGAARPQRVFLRTKAQFITIAGPLSGPVIPIDLGVTSSAPLTDYVNAAILKLDSSYSAGDLASLKAQFALGYSKRTDSSDPETAITGYKINDDGKFAVSP